jgi:hypothetical protein
MYDNLLWLPEPIPSDTNGCQEPTYKLSSLEQGPGTREENPLHTMCLQHGLVNYIVPTMLSECTCRAVMIQDEIAAERDVIVVEGLVVEQNGSVLHLLKMNIYSQMTSVPSSMHR